MTDPITTPEQMREAAVLLPCPFCGEADPEKLLIERLEGTVRHPAFRVCCDNCGASTGYSDRGDHIAAWNRRAIPIAPQPMAVMVKPLTDDDREWIDARADELFRESERQRGGIRGQTIVPQDFRDYFVATATYERILSAIDATSARDVRAAALREAEKILLDWQDSLNSNRLTETAITVGMAADVVLALIDKEGGE